MVLKFIVHATRILTVAFTILRVLPDGCKSYYLKKKKNSIVLGSLLEVFSANHTCKVKPLKEIFLRAMNRLKKIVCNS